MDREKNIHSSLSRRDRIILQYGSIENYLKWCSLHSAWLKAQLDLITFQRPIKDRWECYKIELQNDQKRR